MPSWCLAPAPETPVGTRQSIRPASVPPLAHFDCPPGPGGKEAVSHSGPVTTGSRQVSLSRNAMAAYLEGSTSAPESASSASMKAWRALSTGRVITAPANARVPMAGSRNDLCWRRTGWPGTGRAGERSPHACAGLACMVWSRAIAPVGPQGLRQHLAGGAGRLPFRPVLHISQYRAGRSSPFQALRRSVIGGGQCDGHEQPRRCQHQDGVSLRHGGQQGCTGDA